MESSSDSLLLRDRKSVVIPKERKSAVPQLMLPPEFEELSTVYKFYRLAEGDVIRVELEHEHDADSALLGSPFQVWVVYIQRKDCQLFLFNPISSKSFKLPSIETLPYITGVIRNSHSGLVESFLDFESEPLPPPQHVSKHFIIKIILSSSPTDDDCIVVVIYGHLYRLALCRRRDLEDSDCWTDLDGPLCAYTDIVFDSRTKLLFALNEIRHLEAWDLHSDSIKRILFQGEHFGTGYWPIAYEDDDDLQRKSKTYCIDDDYFVYDNQSHELFIVTHYVANGIQPNGTLVPVGQNSDRFPYKTLAFDVFKLDFIDDHVELQYLEGSLDNRAFFIGFNSGFALSTTNFPELKPNSIYFTDDTRRRQNWQGHDLGIYDYEKSRLSPCYYPIDPDKLQNILPTPIWFTPDVDSECLA